MTRHHESIAAVVAGAGKHEHSAPAVGHDVAGDLRRGETGTLHQRRGILSAERRRLDAAYFGIAIHRDKRA